MTSSADFLNHISSKADIGQEGRDFYSTIGLFVDLMGASCLALDSKQKTDVALPWPKKAEGWQRVEAHDSYTHSDSLHMALYRKDGVYACVMQPVDVVDWKHGIRELLTEAKHIVFGGEPKSHREARKKLGQWFDAYPSMRNNCFLIGQSKGATMALKAASEFNSKVSGTVVIEPFLPLLGGILKGSRWFNKTGSINPETTLILDSTIEAKNVSFERRPLGEYRRLNLGTHAKTAVQAHNMRTWWAFFRSNASLSAPEFGQAPVPALVEFGEASLPRKVSMLKNAVKRLVR